MQTTFSLSMTSPVAKEKDRLKVSWRETHKWKKVTNCCNHFKNLLGSPLDISDENEEITPTFPDLDIKTGPFDQEKNNRSKNSLVERKSSGEDNIPPEVLKRSDLDDIVLCSCNDALVNREKPSLWYIPQYCANPKIWRPQLRRQLSGHKFKFHWSQNLQ